MSCVTELSELQSAFITTEILNRAWQKTEYHLDVHHATDSVHIEIC